MYIYIIYVYIHNTTSDIYFLFLALIGEKRNQDWKEISQFINVELVNLQIISYVANKSSIGICYY